MLIYNGGSSITRFEWIFLATNVQYVNKIYQNIMIKLDTEIHHMSFIMLLFYKCNLK